MLAEVARVEGFKFEDTLTGFKWIGSCAEELNRSGYHALFSYEEAIGFCCGNVVFDKDGISAIGVFTELIYAVYHKGMSLSEHLQRLYDRYGEFVSNNGKLLYPPNYLCILGTIVFATLTGSIIYFVYTRLFHNE